MRNAFLIFLFIMLAACGGGGSDDNTNDTGSSLNLNSIGNKSLLSGESLSFQLSASDPNSQNFIWTADGTVGANNPFLAGATFNENTATFNWTDTANASGNYTVRFTVTNDEVPPASDSETITIQVIGIFAYGEASYNQYCQSCHGSEGIGGDEQILQCIDEASLAFGMARSPMNGIGNQWADYDREFDAILYYLQNVQPQNC